MQLTCIFYILEAQEWQNIDKIFLHRSAEEFAKKNAGERQNLLKFRENLLIFSPRRVNIWRKKDRHYIPQKRTSQKFCGNLHIRDLLRDFTSCCMLSQFTILMMGRSRRPSYPGSWAGMRAKNKPRHGWRPQPWTEVSAEDYLRGSCAGTRHKAAGGRRSTSGGRGELALELARRASSSVSIYEK